jgi:hypoxanthine phosphoribosyltransferase
MGLGPSVSPATESAGDAGPAFAHASEAELSRILDFYQVRWEYEPHVFPILWNTDGDVLESFAPDFYLPDLDLYVEMTTLRQKLVRKKNRKLRRLRELYPDVRIKLFYARDFRALMLKYGRLALAEGLSGTSGQVTPARPYEELLAGSLEPSVDPDGTAIDPPSARQPAVSGEPVATSRRRRRRRPGAVRRSTEAETIADR